MLDVNDLEAIRKIVQEENSKLEDDLFDEIGRTQVYLEKNWRKFRKIFWKRKRHKKC